MPSWVVPILAFIPAFLVFASQKLFGKINWRDFYRISMGLAIAVLLTGAITNCLKVPVGRLRPNFVFRCWPDGKIKFDPATETEFGGFAICNTEAKIENEHRKSFPSGEALLLQ